MTVDNVNHPKHYTSHPSGIECIEITRHHCFNVGNAIKYCWRAGLKNDSVLLPKEKEIEDLKKAIWYIRDRIEQHKKILNVKTIQYVKSFYVKHPSGYEYNQVTNHYNLAIGNAIRCLWFTGLDNRVSSYDRIEVEALNLAIYHIKDRIKELENKTN